MEAASISIETYPHSRESHTTLVIDSLTLHFIYHNILTAVPRNSSQKDWNLLPVTCPCSFPLNKLAHSALTPQSLNKLKPKNNSSQTKTFKRMEIENKNCLCSTNGQNLKINNVVSKSFVIYDQNTAGLPHNTKIILCYNSETICSFNYTFTISSLHE